MKWKEGQVVKKNSIIETTTPLITENYEQRIVGWIDILGFSAFAQKEENFETIKYFTYDMARQCHPGAIRKITEEIAPGVFKKDISLEQPSYSFLSDTAVISLPYKEENSTDKTLPEPISVILAIIISISEFQCKLLFNERFKGNPMLTRGCLTAGKIFHRHPNNDVPAASYITGYEDRMPIIFGPAISDAHEHETKVAIYPRVVLSNKIIEIMENTKPCGPFIKKDSDGFCYIDYLYYNYIRSKNDLEVFRRDLSSLREKTKEKLQQPNLAVALKWQWLREYMDRFCTENKISLEDGTHTA